MFLLPGTELRKLVSEETSGTSLIFLHYCSVGFCSEGHWGWVGGWSYASVPAKANHLGCFQSARSKGPQASHSNFGLLHEDHILCIWRPRDDFYVSEYLLNGKKKSTWCQRTTLHCIMGNRLQVVVKFWGFCIEWASEKKKKATLMKTIVLLCIK